MQSDTEDRKSGFDWLRLIIYLIIASGFSLYAFFRLSQTYHNIFIGLTASLLTEASLVGVLYMMDNGRQH
jgi:hypothetical protein